MRGSGQEVLAMPNDHECLLDYFWKRVEKLPDDCERHNKETLPTGCWQWGGKLNPNGYGRFWSKGIEYLTHRFSYQTFVGEIPKGKELDHLCRNRWCCNHEHLEALTRKEHIIRGNGLAGINARKTHCPKEHPLSGDNLYIRPSDKKRRCKACLKEQGRW